MSEEAAAQQGIALELDLPDNLGELKPAVEQCVYRVAQEAITNVVKHAKAKRMTVKIEFTNNKLSLTVQDDGVGFNVSNSQGHFGLTGMKERAAFFNGTLQIDSQPKNGTKIMLII
jgi:signal transduction histidine kinase